MIEPQQDDPIALGKDEEDDMCEWCEFDAPNCICDEVDDE